MPGELHVVAGYAIDTYEKLKGVFISNLRLYITYDVSPNRAGELARQSTSGKSFEEAWYWATRTKIGRSKNARPVKTFGRDQVISPEDVLSRHMGRREIDVVMSRAVREGGRIIARVELVYKAIETRKGELYLAPLYAVEFDDLDQYYVPAVEDRDEISILVNAKTG